MDAIVKIMNDPHNGRESIARIIGEDWDEVWRKYEIFFRADFNGDFVLDNEDLRMFLVGGLYFQDIRFDLNLDGGVDINDLYLFAQQLGISEQEAAKLVAEYASKSQTVAIQNYPNPFNTSTTITFPVREAGQARVVVFNAIGQCVATLHDGAVEPGLLHVQWDGSGASSGQYFARAEVNGQVLASRMTLVK